MRPLQGLLKKQVCNPYQGYLPTEENPKSTPPLRGLLKKS